MNELTERLSTEQPVVMGGADRTLAELRRRVEEIGYVSIKFTGTRGGTDLVVKLDREATDASAADFERGSGSLRIKGSLILNGDPVLAVATLDLSTLEGTGRLIPVVGESPPGS